MRRSASNVQLQCFRHPSTPTDGQCSTQIQPWPLPLTNAYSAMETHDVNRNNCNLCVVHWQCMEIAVSLGKSTDRIVQQMNHTKICKNHDKCEFGQSFRKIIDASENPIYIYIHGLTDRIFNTATKPQKLFYLRVILSTCFSAIFFFIFNLSEKVIDFILFANYWI